MIAELPTAVLHSVLLAWEGKSLEMQSIFSFFILLKCTKLHSHSKFLHKKRNRRIIMQIVQRGWSHDRASLRGFVCTKFTLLFYQIEPLKNWSSPFFIPVTDP